MPTCSGRPLENSYAEKHNECGRLTKGLAAAEALSMRLRRRCIELYDGLVLAADEIERAGLRRADDLRKILDGGS